MASPGATHARGVRAGLAWRGAVVKACPVVLRGGGVLVFRHPRAGVQLVKGGIEPGETAARAAARELAEEAGIALRPARGLGRLRPMPGMAWRLVLMRPPPLPDRWSHRCADDGGHLYRFFWHPLGGPAGRAWHPVHARALAGLRRALAR